MTQSFSSRIYLVSHHSGRFDKILSKNIFLLIKSKKYVTIKWCKPNMISIFCISYKSKSLRNNKNSQNFGIVCHTEVCLNFSRLAAKLSGMITKFQGCSLKIQHRSYFDLNGLKNGPSLHFKNRLNAFVPKIDETYEL